MFTRIVASKESRAVFAQEKIAARIQTAQVIVAHKAFAAYLEAVIVIAASGTYLSGAWS